MIKLYPVSPVPAPRQVQKDKWRPSDPVKRYRAFRDELALRQLWVPIDFHHIVFVMPILTTMSKSKVDALDGTPHLQKPDRDNLEKALLDSAFSDDCRIWNGQTTKIWGRFGMIIIADHPLPVEPGQLLTRDVYAAFNKLMIDRGLHCVLLPHVLTWQKKAMDLTPTA